MKFRQLKDIILNVRMLPDLKLRTFVILFSICMVVSSFIFGLILGKKIEAEKSIVISGAYPYVAYDETIINSAKNPPIVFTEADKNFVASHSGKVYYPKDCKGYSRIKEENRVWFKNEILAKASGYSLAKNCSIKK